MPESGQQRQPPRPPPHCIALVSGKGGVGKTFIAANFAYCCSLAMNVLLVDFDLQNQGLTGLFASQLDRAMIGACDWILSRQPLAAADLIHIAPNLAFLPAFSDMRHRDVDWTAWPTALTVHRLRAAVREVIEQHGIDLVILDCHGGLDELSFVSYMTADMTIVVTETDRVTFNGTLELLEYYLRKQRTVRALHPADAHQPDGDDQPIIWANRLLFLFNRINNRMDYRIYSKTIEEQFVTNIPELRGAISDTAFVPADSLGRPLILRIPFSSFRFCRILMIGKKIALLFSRLFPDVSKLVATVPEWQGVRSARFVRRVGQYVGSPDDDRSQAVFGGFGLAQIALFLLTVPILIVGGGTPAPSLWQSALALTVSVLIAAFSLYLCWLDIRVAGFYRMRLRYERRTTRLLRRRAELSYYLRVCRLLSMMLVTYVSSGFAVLETIIVVAFGYGAATGNLH